MKEVKLRLDLRLLMDGENIVDVAATPVLVGRKPGRPKKAKWTFMKASEIGGPLYKGGEFKVRKRTEAAKELLRKLLQAPISAIEAIEEGAFAGIPKRTIYRAAKELDVIKELKYDENGERGWWWRVES